MKRLVCTSLGCVCLSLSVARPEQLLQGQGKSGDWQSDAPGVEHRITVHDLPKVYDTPSAHNAPKVVPQPEGAWPKVPEGFEVSLYARGFSNPRVLRTAPNGDIFVVESRANTIRVLRDADGDGKPEINEKFLTGLNKPFGIAFYPPGPDPQFLYVANTDGIVRFPYRNGDLKVTGKAEEIANLSPGGQLEGGGHWTRDIVFSRDGKKLYASVGSKSNVDDEDAHPIEKNRARIFEFNPDGSEKEVYAWGIRNPVGLAIHPQTGALWTSVNERDGLGDDLVPDYITHVQKGGFYGWPWFYIGSHQDPRHKGLRPELAGQVIIPDVLLQAHSASLNMLFYHGSQFPPEYRGDGFAALHGSWNRAQRTGYKVVRVPLNEGRGRRRVRGFYDGFCHS